MNKTPALLGLALALTLVLGPWALALDCSSVSMPNKQVCRNILDSNLSVQEKEVIISNLEYAKKYYPDHNYILLRNTALVINDAPYGVSKQQGQFVKDAWASIFAVLPSVLYNNSLFVSDNAKVLTGFNYKIIIPSDYVSSGYPDTNEGDCKRTYSLINNVSQNNVYVNGAYQGNGSLADIQVQNDSQISIIYSVNADVEVQHYNWNQYCCKWYGSGRCRKYCYSCNLASTEIKEDSLSIPDQISVKYYNNSLLGSLSVLDEYSSTTKLATNFSNSIEITFNDSSYSFYQNFFEINYSKTPYYIATLKARDYNKEQTNNLLKESNNLIVKNTQGCKIRAFDLFNTKETNCDLEYYDYGFYIASDRLGYASGTQINVSIIPQNITLNISYGNQTQIASGNITFTAELYVNKIKGVYQGKTAEHFIFVYDKSKLALLGELIFLFLLIYIFYRLGRKYFGRRK